MAHKQSPSTVLARKLAVALAKRCSVLSGTPCKPQYDEAFRWVYANSNAQGRAQTERWIEALNANMDMADTARHMGLFT